MQVWPVLALLGLGERAEGPGHLINSRSQNQAAHSSADRGHAGTPTEPLSVTMEDILAFHLLALC